MTKVETVHPNARHIESRHADRVRRDIAQRMPIAVILFLSMMSVAAIIEWRLYPDRILVQSTCILSLIVVCAGGLWATRLYPHYAALVALLTILLLGFSLNFYFALIGDESELSLVAMISLITGIVILFPWGPYYQAAAAIGITASYFTTYAYGPGHRLPVAYSAFSLGTHALLTTIGAGLLDQYRRRALHQTVNAAHLAEVAARANVSKTQFLATVSHELRTPLNIIFGYTDLLIEGSFDAQSERTDALHRIREQSGHLLDMIQALLDINRLEAGNIDLNKSPIEVGQITSRLQRTVPQNWCKDGVQLSWQESGSDAVLESDADKLEIVLRNLIHNALKYTDRGEVLVHALATPNSDTVEFSVVDSGQGIPQDDLERIFEMFRQSESAPPREGGVGLGLFLAKQLTQALGGTIHAESKVGEGSRFTVSLPLIKRPQDANGRKEFPAEQPSTAALTA